MFALAWAGLFACSEAGPGTEAGQRSSEEARSALSPARPGAKPARVALADEPRVDLLDNRFRWHLHGPGGAGLVVPVAAEGFRKYTQEYTNPWRSVVEVDGRAGRVLASSRAILRVPWRADWAGAEPSVVTLVVNGLVRGQRVTVQHNGKRAGNATLGEGWQQVSVPAGGLRNGENELVVFFGKRGKVAGKRAYGLVRAIAVGPPVAEDAWPPLVPVASLSGGKALVGERLTAAFEIPADAYLTFEALGAGAREVRVRPLKGATRTLYQSDTGRGTRQVSLTRLAGQLVELELRAAPGLGWGKPALALADAPTGKAPAAYDNLLLLVVDALRSDKLRFSNPKTRVKTTSMSASVSERGVVMSFTQAASPSSPPSLASIQTGMIPRVHGVVGDSGKLRAGTPMISTALGTAGVATAYYGNNPFGMARLEAPGRWTEFHQPLREGKGHDCKPLVADMLDFARRQSEAGKRFFISSLPYEPHTPYRYHEGITDKYHRSSYGPPVGKSVDGVLLSALASESKTLTDNQWKELFALYDGEVEYWDGCFGALIDGLGELGVADRTAIIITSDHGEGMFEHGRGGHAFGHYAELANVPFAIVARGLAPAGATVDVTTSHLDIAPTILDLMGVAPERKIQGRSVIPMVLRRGPWVPRVVSLEYGRSYALRATRFKYIVDYQQNESVFDLVADPTEQTDLLEKQPIAVRYLRDMAGFFLAHRSRWHAATMGDWNNHSEGFLEYLGVSD